MITKQEPTQPKLWSRFQDLLSEVALEELDRGWQGVFHRMILQQLPIEIMEEKFNKNTGRPTKELYSVCGLLLIMNYFGWTLSQARLNYMVDLGVQYALNIEKDAVELSERTLYRYLDWLRNHGWIFGETSPMKLQKQGKVYTSEEQLGYDMEKLIEKFSGNELFSNMTSYKNLVRVFREQFVDADGKAELKPHPGGKILLNPSDPDAEIGHKGIGYQVQIAETCSDDNEVQLITAAIPQGASVSDMDSETLVQEKLKAEGHLPEKLYADAGYGSDDNYMNAAKDGIELIAPAPHQPEGKVGLDECRWDNQNRIVECPAGKHPMVKSFKNGRGKAIFHNNSCGNCPLKEQCRSRKNGKYNRVFEYTSADLRSMQRRQRESTAEFRNDYGHKRSPIEGLNGRLKQFTPLRRLHVRGRPAVFHSIYAILAVHNIMQMVRYAKIQTKKAAATALFRFFFWIFSSPGKIRFFMPHNRRFSRYNAFFLQQKRFGSF